MDNVTTRQRRILEYIRADRPGARYPPTVREIGEAVGLTSSSSVHAQLPTSGAAGPAPPRRHQAPGDGASAPGTTPVNSVNVPLLGPASPPASPSWPMRTSRKYLALPSGYAGEEGHFALRVSGDSMIGPASWTGTWWSFAGRTTRTRATSVAALLTGPAEEEAPLSKRAPSRGTGRSFPFRKFLR